MEAVQWSSINRMSANCEKTRKLLVCFACSKPDIPSINVRDKPIERVSTVKVLGMTISRNCLGTHTLKPPTPRPPRDFIFCDFLRSYRAGLEITHIVHIYTSMIDPGLEFAWPAWYIRLPGSLSEKLESVQPRALRVAVPDSSYRWIPAEVRSADSPWSSSGNKQTRGPVTVTQTSLPILPNRRVVCYNLRGDVQRDTIVGKYQRYKKHSNSIRITSLAIIINKLTIYKLLN